MLLSDFSEEEDEERKVAVAADDDWKPHSSTSTKKTDIF